MSDKPDPGDNPLDEMLAGLMSDGVLQSKGSFTLNHERAREQMGAARFSEPDRYVLGLVQAAVMRGAEKIAFEIDTDDMVMTFDGPPFTDAELQRVFSELKLDPADPESALRWELAMAVAAAESMDPKHITLLSGSGEEAAVVLIQKDQPYRFGAVESSLVGTRIHVKSRLEAGQLVDSIKGLSRDLPLQELVRKRCRYAGVEVMLEGETVSAGLTLDRVMGETDLEGQGFEGIAGHIIDRIDPAEVRLVRHGVWLDSVISELEAPGYVAVVESAAIQMDLGQAAAVRDDKLEAILDACTQTYPTALLRLCQKAKDSPEVHPAWVRTVVRSALLGEHLPEDEQAPLHVTLVAMPLFRVLPGDGSERSRWSIDQVRQWLYEGGRLGYVPPLRDDPFGGDAHTISKVIAWCRESDGRALKLASQDEVGLVSRLFGRRARNVTGTDDSASSKPGQKLESKPAQWGHAEISGDEEWQKDELPRPGNSARSWILTIMAVIIGLTIALLGDVC